MKNIFLIIPLAIAAIFVGACNGNAGKNSLSDSLGNTITDSAGRYDTMSYERMQTKTGNTDTAGGGQARKNDTAHYERMPQKSDSLQKNNR
ncbi:MAG TPA: hypothetical protein VD993_14295 [Chitinophagaceae bacterium]|nr:hypothetical protein [Chitinophagaceae bacterium]